MCFFKSKMSNFLVILQLLDIKCGKMVGYRSFFVIWLTESVFTKYGFSINSIEQVLQSMASFARLFSPQFGQMNLAVFFDIALLLLSII